MTISEKIIASMRYKNLQCANAQALIRLLISALEGASLHFYTGWSRSCGRYKLQRHSSVETAYDVLRRAGVSVTLDNDAPRGGAIGDCFRVVRCNHRAASELRTLLI